MLIRASSTLALYCSRCGKIELHIISRFGLPDDGKRQLVCSCGQVQGAVTASGRRECFLRLPCPICEGSHLIRLSGRMLWQSGVERIYCPEQNFELGFVGEQDAAIRLISDNCYAAEALAREMDERDGEDDRRNSGIILEALNRIHDIAERGGVYCRCGSRDIRAEVSADGIELACDRCGGRRMVAVGKESDLADLAHLGRLEIIPYRLNRRKN